jgi:hypothetical protein
LQKNTGNLKRQLMTSIEVMGLAFFNDINQAEGDDPKLMQTERKI